MSRYGTNEEILAAVKSLLDAWCERKLLYPLSVLAGPYVAFNGLGDGWGELLEGLKTVRGFCRKDVTFVELRKVDDLIRAVDDALQSRH